MASVTYRKMPAGTWKAVVRGGRGETLKTKTFDRKEDARTWGDVQRRTFQRAIATGDMAHAHTFGEAVALYRREEPVRALERKSELEWWLQVLGADTALSDLRSDTIRVALRAYMAKPATRKMRDGKTRTLPHEKSGATANRRLSYGSAVWKLAADDGLALSGPEHNPFRGVSRWSEPEERTRVLSAEELERLFAAARASEWSRLYLRVLMAATTGGRPSEIQRLRWCDVNLTLLTVAPGTSLRAGVAVVPRDVETGRRSKTKVERRLYLLEPAVKELARVRRPKEEEPDDALIFGSHTAPSRPNGIHTPFTYRKSWEEALREAKLVDVTPYMLRHTFATVLVERLVTEGVEESVAQLVVSKLLGHSSLQTTRRYFHPRDEVLLAVVNRAVGHIAAPPTVPALPAPGE